MANELKEQLEEIAGLCCQECESMIRKKTERLEKKYGDFNSLGPVNHARAARKAMKIGKGVCKKCKRKIKQNYK